MSIIQVPYEVVQYRQWVQESFRLHPLPLATPSAGYTSFDLFRPNACLTYAGETPPFPPPDVTTGVAGVTPVINSVVNQRIGDAASNFGDSTASIAASDVSSTVASPGILNDDGKFLELRDC